MSDALHTGDNMATIGNVYCIRLNSYKNFRHYGGREITVFAHITKAVLIGIQEGENPYIMELCQNVMRDSKLVYAIGRKIAVRKADFNITETKLEGIT